MYPGKISRTSGIKYQRAAWLLVTAAPQGVKNSVPAAAGFKLRRPLKDLGGVLLTRIIGPHCSAPAVAPFSLRAKGKVSRCGKMSSVTWSPLSCTNATSVRHPQGPLYFPVPRTPGSWTLPRFAFLHGVVTFEAYTKCSVTERLSVLTRAIKYPKGRAF